MSHPLLTQRAAYIDLEQLAGYKWLESKAIASLERSLDSLPPLTHTEIANLAESVFVWSESIGKYELGPDSYQNMCERETHLQEWDQKIGMTYATVREIAEHTHDEEAFYKELYDHHVGSGAASADFGLLSVLKAAGAGSVSLDVEWKSLEKHEKDAFKKTYDYVKNNTELTQADRGRVYEEITGQKMEIGTLPKSLDVYRVSPRELSNTVGSKAIFSGEIEGVLQEFPQRAYLQSYAIADTRIDGDLVVDGKAAVRRGFDDKTLDIIGQSLLPVGAIVLYAGTEVPDGWLRCDGQEVDVEHYPELVKVLGGAFVQGKTGSICVPDMRGRTVVGSGNVGKLSRRSLGDVGGAERVRLTVEEMPRHNHEQYAVWDAGKEMPRGKGRATYNGDVANVDGGLSNYPTAKTGGGKAHENMPPFIVVGFIIKARSHGGVNE